MLIIALLILYGIAATVWALASLILIICILKHHFVSLASWFVIIAYGAISSNIFFFTWRAFSGLNIQFPLLY